jgi:cysteinyl-tRNA synthetase
VVSGKECVQGERNLIDRLVVAKRGFIEAMNDDFNTEKAIGILLKASEHIEKFSQTCKRFTTKETGEQARAICKQFNDVMGVCKNL